mgnify:CR=1 FL=1
MIAKYSMIQLNIRLNKKLHKDYKKFCKQHCLVMGRRIEELIKMDLERRLIKLPEVKL